MRKIKPVQWVTFVSLFVCICLAITATELFVAEQDIMGTCAAAFSAISGLISACSCFAWWGSL